ncbi:hypothetical protein UFOVP143_55 [uncultured Caudovirales phage]|uniref:Uncharacterized protein n=1 Tax=uncultured Caudovirales phage TaxID=2100421 RepID=A0A6J7VM22_9CAUD|nr:hypothetical protein UFOVP143_55 [uncultured Caudovirales phage]
MAKAPKKIDTAAAEAVVIPAELAAAVEAGDTVLQAHITRQANHHNDLAPALAKKALEDKERDEALQEHELIAERNRKAREAQQAEQDAIDEKQKAHGLIASIGDEIAAMELVLLGKKADLERYMNLVKG